MKDLDQNPEKKISKRSNTRKTRARKIALITGLGIATIFNTGCGGNNESDLTKTSKKLDDKIEQRDDDQEDLKDLQEERKELDEKINKKEQEIVEDNKEVNELRIELQKAKVNPPK